jgi:hypothetical protein
VFPSAGITRVQQYYAPVRLPADPSPCATLKPRPSIGRASPVARITIPACRAHYPGGSGGRLSIASPSVLPSPFCRRVGIRISTFEASSGFTRVTARQIAQPPKAAVVTRLRSSQLPSQTARQLPEQSTIRWVEPSSTGETRPRGALQNQEFRTTRKQPKNRELLRDRRRRNGRWERAPPAAALWQQQRHLCKRDLSPVPLICWARACAQGPASPTLPFNSPSFGHKTDRASARNERSDPGRRRQFDRFDQSR